MHQSKVEIIPNIYRLNISPSEHFEFNQFLIQDEKTVLIHTGKLSFYNELKSMVLDKLTDRPLDYIVFSHFEADECGSVNQWLHDFPNSQVYCNKIANINLSDFLIRPAQVLKDGEIIELGARQLRMIETPHFPHNWDAHMWYEEKDSILFSSDFCCHGGISKPIIEENNSDKIINFYEKGKFIPYGKTTNENLDKLSKLNLNYIAPMHGSVITPKVTQLVFSEVMNDLKAKSRVY